METIARNTPQLTQATQATPASAAPAGFPRKCATFTLKALKAVGKAYVEGARSNPYWIGAYWLPSVPRQPRDDGR
jgi:hypothetical protein